MDGLHLKNRETKDATHADGHDLHVSVYVVYVMCV